MLFCNIDINKGIEFLEEEAILKNPFDELILNNISLLVLFNFALIFSVSDSLKLPFCGFLSCLKYSSFDLRCDIGILNSRLRIKSLRKFVI